MISSFLKKFSTILYMVNIAFIIILLLNIGALFVGATLCVILGHHDYYFYSAFAITNLCIAYVILRKVYKIF